MLDANVDTHTSPEQRMRAQQVFRGMLSSRRVASGRALDLLESVDIADLPEDGKGESTSSPWSTLALICASLCDLLQRVRSTSTGEHYRDPTETAQVQAHLWKPLYQEVVRRQRHMPLL